MRLLVIRPFTKQLKTKKTKENKKYQGLINPWYSDDAAERLEPSRGYPH
ncbi:hypothetical protein CHCC14821_1648 [Bacillus paralicheniformis]|nr:hypothetical protein CHCC14821_1648 [Bacillus paralicheniformis]TWM67452.1 hypothetical protein CHCC14814_4168 [Bacillus paralicheniformis]